MKGKAATALILALVAPPAAAASAQQRFLEALALLEQGRPQEGAALLRVLYEETPTPRIRLELARALMLAGNTREAKRLFVEAYKDNPPPVVKTNILAFLDRIDRENCKLRLSLSISHYGNPLQQPGSYTLNFGGINLTYKADQTYRNLWGETAGAQYSREFEGGLTLSAGAAYRSLPHDAADRLTAEVSLGRHLGSGPFEVQIGAAHLGQMGQTFTLPYAQVTYTHALGRRLAIQPTVRAGYYAADAGPGVTGWQADAFIPLVYAPTPAKVLAAGPVVLRHEVGLGEQSYTSAGLRALAKVKGSLLNVEGGVQARMTQFDAIDPFWGARRTDRELMGSLMVSSDIVRLGPVLPAVGLSCDVTRSTIRYFQQSNCDMLFEVRKLF